MLPAQRFLPFSPSPPHRDCLSASFSRFYCLSNFLAQLVIVVFHLLCVCVSAGVRVCVCPGVCVCSNCVGQFLSVAGGRKRARKLIQCVNKTKQLRETKLNSCLKLLPLTLLDSES